MSDGFTNWTKRNPKRKCISKKCEDCQFFQDWDYTDEKSGLRKIIHRCGIQVLFEEIPLIRQCVTEAQASSDQARNRAVETKDAVIDFSAKAVKTISAAFNKQIGMEDIKKIED